MLTKVFSGAQHVNILKNETYRELLSNCISSSTNNAQNEYKYQTKYLHSHELLFVPQYFYKMEFGISSNFAWALRLK